MFKATIVIALGALCAFGQTATTITKQAIKISDEAAFGPIGITAALAGPMSSIPGAPYSAQAVTQSVQTLADGNRITQTTTNSVARDSLGRVRREESLPGFGNDGSEPPHIVLIEDPVAGVHITLDSPSKTAVRMPFGQMKKGAEMVARNSVPPMTAGNKMWFSTASAGVMTGDIKIITNGHTIPDVPASKSDLGTQSIEGVPAQGTRMTRTLAAGTVGNDLPIVITTETWYSPDLKVLVMSKSNDPRMGETTYRLTNITRSEPDPALFQIPGDYTVKEGPANTFVYQEFKK